MTQHFGSCEPMSHQTSKNFHPTLAKTEPVTSSKDAIQPIRKFRTKILAGFPSTHSSPPGPPQFMSCNCLISKNTNQATPILSQLEYLVANQRPNIGIGAKFGKQTTTRDQNKVLTISEKHKTKQKTKEQSRIELRRGSYHLQILSKDLFVGKTVFPDLGFWFSDPFHTSIHSSVCLF